MSEDKKRAPRRLPFGDELELYIRDATPEELRDLAVRIAKETRLQEQKARREQWQPLLGTEPKA